MQLRKASRHIPLADFVSWTTACFQTQEARDRFLRVAATLPASDVEVEPMYDESRSALVRWRPGKFLGLNDVAYAHGGKIHVMQRRGRDGGLPGDAGSVLGAAIRSKR